MDPRKDPLPHRLWQADIKQHFQDLAPQDQLRLLKDLIGFMEEEVRGQKGVNPAQAEQRVPAEEKSPPQAQPPAAGPDPGYTRLDDELPPLPPLYQDLGRTPGIKATGASTRDKTPAPDLEWQDFDAQMDHLIHSGGEYHEIHKLRLVDAMERYRSMLVRHGYLRSPLTLEELARKELLRQESQATTPPPTWNAWVAKDQDTLDRPKPHDWSAWVLPGDDEPEALD